MKIFYFLILLMLIPLYAIEWTPVGPGGGGAMYVPAISPHDDSLMFISCDMSGIYRSTDGGESWTMLDYRQLRSSTMCAPVFHPTDPEIIWDEDSRDWVYNLRRSTDGGASWEQVWAMPDWGEPYDLLCLHDEPLCVLVGSEDFGLYRSTNGTDFTEITNVWEARELAENDFGVWASAWDAILLSTDRGLNFDTISVPFTLDDYHGVTNLSASDSNVFVIVDNEALWRSDDGGVTWSDIVHAADYGGWTELELLESECNYTWLSIDGCDNMPTVLLSLDGGDSFAPVFFCDNSWGVAPNIGDDWNTLELGCWWGESALGFGVSRTNPNVALWTDYGRAFATSNAGTSWTEVYTDFAGTGSPAAGSSWSSAGLEVTSSWDIFISTTDDFIRIAYTDIGGAYSADNGESWLVGVDGIPGDWDNTTYDLELDTGTAILWGAFSGLHDIPGGWSFNEWDRSGDGGVAYSTDGGLTWITITGEIPDKPVTSIAIDYGSSPSARRIFAAVWSDGIWRSNDGGTNWERCSSGLDVGDGTCTSDGPNTHIVEVQVHPSGTIFALKTKYIRDGSIIKNDGGLWRSTDGGDNWECISSYVADCPPVGWIDTGGEHSWADPVSFTIDPDDTNHIWVGAQTVNNGKTQGGLYETTDGGANWSRIFDIYGAFRVTPSIYYPGVMYLATVGDDGNGIMHSSDCGTTWVHDEDFPFMVTTRITEDPNDSNIVWVNTFGGGVWKGVLSSGTIITGAATSRPGQISLHISPNPFNSSCEITVNGAGGFRETPLHVEIFDLRGRLVTPYSDGKPSSFVPLNKGDRGDTEASTQGVYIWTPDESISSGIFFVRASIDGKTVIKRIIYLK